MEESVCNSVICEINSTCSGTGNWVMLLICRSSSYEVAVLTWLWSYGHKERDYYPTDNNFIFRLWSSLVSISHDVLNMCTCICTHITNFKKKNAYSRARLRNLDEIVNNTIEAALILNSLLQLQHPALFSMNTTHWFK